jgi:hypothetical protein
VPLRDERGAGEGTARNWINTRPIQSRDDPAHVLMI